MSDDEIVKKMNSKLTIKSAFSIGERIAEVGKNVPLLQVATAIAEQIQKQIQLHVENEEIAQKQLNYYKPNEEKYNNNTSKFYDSLNYISMR